MTRKIIFIIIGALLFLALLWILWFWLLHRAPVADNGTPGGFATSSDRTTSGGLGVGESSNTGTPLPGTGTPTDTGIDTQAGSIDTNSSGGSSAGGRSEEHTSELQSQFHLVCRLLLEKK